MLKVLLKERACANIPAGSLMVACILVGVSKGHISRAHYDAERTFLKFTFCDYFNMFKTLKSLENKECQIKISLWWKKNSSNHLSKSEEKSRIKVRWDRLFMQAVSKQDANTVIFSRQICDFFWKRLSKARTIYCLIDLSSLKAVW